MGIEQALALLAPYEVHELVRTIEIQGENSTFRVEIRQRRSADGTLTPVFRACCYFLRTVSYKHGSFADSKPIDGFAWVEVGSTTHRECATEDEALRLLLSDINPWLDAA